MLQPVDLALLRTRPHVTVDLDDQRPIAARVPHLGDLHDRVTAGVEDVDAPAGLGVWDGDLVAAHFNCGGKGRDLGLSGLVGLELGLRLGHVWLLLFGLLRVICLESVMELGCVRWHRGFGEHGIGEGLNTVHLAH